MRGNETDGRTNFGVSEAKDFILYECMATTSFPIKTVFCIAMMPSTCRPGEECQLVVACL